MVNNNFETNDNSYHNMDNITYDNYAVIRYNV